MSELYTLGWWRVVVPPRAVKWVVKIKTLGARYLRARQIRLRKKHVLRLRNIEREAKNIEQKTTPLHE